MSTSDGGRQQPLASVAATSDPGRDEQHDDLPPAQAVGPAQPEDQAPHRAIAPAPAGTAASDGHHPGRDLGVTGLASVTVPWKSSGYSPTPTARRTIPATGGGGDDPPDPARQPPVRVEQRDQVSSGRNPGTQSQLCSWTTIPTRSPGRGDEREGGRQRGERGREPAPSSTHASDRVPASRGRPSRMTSAITG